MFYNEYRNNLKSEVVELGVTRREAGEELVTGLFYTGTTSAMPWNVLEGAITGVPPLTPDARIAMLVRLVNGVHSEALTLEEWRRFVGTELASPIAGLPDTARIGIPANAIDALTDALEAIAADPEVAASHRTFRRNAEAITNGRMVVIPRVRWRGPRLVREEYIVCRSPAEALIHALLLLLDIRTGLAKRLKQCQLKSCGRFAFVLPRSKAGHPLAHYCSRQHRLEQERESARIRVALWRKQRGT